MEVNLQQNIENVKRRIAIAAQKRGMALEDIALVAVSKTVPAEKINQAIRLGIKIIGENKVQEAQDKFPRIADAVEKHMVGHLQRNKVKHAVRLFDMIQSVDSLRLAEEINHRAENRMPVLIEVNTSGEASKYGCAPNKALELLRETSRLPQLQVRGFMTIGLFSDDPEKVRPCFKMLKEIFDEAQKLDLPNSDISILSMGMTADFELAIEEGANMVRIGTAIFGPRSY